MKRLSFLLSMVAIAATAFLSSCGDNNEDPKPAPKITAAFVGISGTNADADAGTPVKINYTATAGEGIKSITATAKYGTTTVNVFPEKTKGFKSSTADDATVDYVCPSDDEVTITLTVTDEKSQTSTATLTLNKEVVVTLKTKSAILMGAQANTTNGQFFGSVENKVYKLAEAKTNAATVDFVFMHRNDASGRRILAGSSDSNVDDIYNADNSNPNRVSTWTVRNEAAFYPITPAEYTSITDSKKWEDVLATKSATSPVSAVKDLVVGSSFLFVTTKPGTTGETINAGVLTVKAVTGTSFSDTNSSITLEIKSAF